MMMHLCWGYRVWIFLQFLIDVENFPREWYFLILLLPTLTFVYTCLSILIVVYATFMTTCGLYFLKEILLLLNKSWNTWYHIIMIDANDITLNEMKRKKRGKQNEKHTAPSEELCYSLFIFDIRRKEYNITFKSFHLERT